MEQLYVAHGKINLALDILYKREDEYHEIKSIMQQISLKDELYFSEIPSGIIIESDSKELPLDSGNLIYKAWQSMKDISGLERGIKVRVKKNIPMAAGLAGGSSDCAASLRAINNLWNLNKSDTELMDIGRLLGADVPFCIMGGTALAEGIGEKLTPLKPFKDYHILIVNPGIKISTTEVYRKINLSEKRYDIDKLISCMENENLDCVAASMENKMEEVVLSEYPVIAEIKNNMLKNGATGSLMSGSGSTVFGLYKDKDQLDFAYKVFSKQYSQVYLCKTI